MVAINGISEGYVPPEVEHVRTDKDRNTKLRSGLLWTTKLKVQAAVNS